MLARQYGRYFYRRIAALLREAEHPPGLPWWRRVDGACWLHPEGHNSHIDDRLDHPVVHICWFDAIAYCKWSGVRLPFEIEWEMAARANLKRKRFPWGNELTPGMHAMNVWQGSFPAYNSAEDGYAGTAPVNSFQPNGFGLYNMTGNVWEWSADLHKPLSDLSFGETYFQKELNAYNPRSQRGGSYLCHASYCDRYQVHSRTKNHPDSSTGNCGFRVAANVDRKS